MAIPCIARFAAKMESEWKLLYKPTGVADLADQPDKIRDEAISRQSGFEDGHLPADSSA